MSVCVVCKGSRMLCGKSRCPIVARIYIRHKIEPLLGKEIEGSSPPGIFVGRTGYPYIFIGPLIPPVKGDTSLLDTPEDWIGKSIDEIAEFRFKLVRGMHRIHVSNFDGKIESLTRELAFADCSVSADAEFLKRPRGRMILDDDVQPFGPSAKIKQLETENIKFDHRIEKAFYDGDLKARDAVILLYMNKTPVSRIQRAFSAGGFGLTKSRRWVPTRWSITAVDSILSLHLVRKIKDYKQINEYRIYESWNLDNRFLVFLLPEKWKYELIEAWYPRTIWNPEGRKTVIYSDWEGYDGRKTYAEIGGCYYAARLAVSEFLEKERRQATVLILREIHPGYIMPVGVWNVRENVRNAFKKIPRKFDRLEDALRYISGRLEIPLKRWIRESRILKDLIYQKKLTDF